MCEIYVTTGFVTKNNGHLILSDLIKNQPTICILFSIKITTEPVAKKIPKDLFTSEHLDPSQFLYLHGYGMEIALVPMIWEWIMTVCLW